MTYTISALDLHYLVKELQQLISAKVDKIYQPEKTVIIIRFHIPNTGKKILRIDLPSHMFLTDFKGEIPEQPSGFCQMLRKNLGNSRVREIKQLGFERITKFVLETKEGKFHLYIELFSQGNLILTTEDDMIKGAVVTKKWKDRTIRGNIKYEYPKRDVDFNMVNKEDFQKVIKESDKENIVKILALEFGLGGLYAEELCMRANVDKAKKELGPEELNSLYKEAEKLRDDKLSAMQYEKTITPIKLVSKKDGKAYATFSDVLDKVLTSEVQQDQQDKQDAVRNKELNRLEKVIAKQEETMKKLEKSIELNHKKGEILFEHYQVVSEILTELKKAQMKFSWKEIKERLKGHKIIKEIHEKNKEIVIEI